MFAVVFYCYWLALLRPFIFEVDLREVPWFLPLIFAVFALLPLTVIASLPTRLWAGRCDVYAVTNRRAIALIRGTFHYRLHAWDAHDYLEISRGKNGTGSIIYECREARHTTNLEGLLDLPGVETVAALIEHGSDEGD